MMINNGIKLCVDILCIGEETLFAMSRWPEIRAYLIARNRRHKYTAIRSKKDEAFFMLRKVA